MAYLKELRKVLGSQPLIVAGACVFIEDGSGRILLQFRSDNKTWGLPGGSLELNETLEECARREIFEETRLSLGDISFFNIFSGPAHVYTCPNGDIVHNVTVAYRCHDYSGVPLADGDESSELKFFDTAALPGEINPNDRPMLELFLPSLKA